jgi:hypothetical protein
LAWCAAAGGAAVFAACVNLSALEREGAVMLVVGVIAAAVGLAAQIGDDEKTAQTRRWTVAAGLPLCASLALVFALELRQIRNEAHPHGLDEEYQTALAFAEHVPAGELIIASGPSERDQHGLLRAANPSYYFFWMDRKGFTLHDDQQSLDSLEQLRDRGARYFVAERSSLTAAPELERQLRESFKALDETEQAVLFDLETRSLISDTPTEAAWQASTN